MGIAGFFLWLRRWYGPCIEDVPESVVQALLKGEAPPEADMGHWKFDNLYLDMNGLVHPCCHDTAPLPEPKSEEEMFDRIFSQLDLVFRVVQPRKCLVMCVDGVAPQSKMNQQRSRRFRAAEERAESDQLAMQCADELVEMGLPRPSPKSRWDHNVITPSTPFMERLGVAVEWFIGKKVNEDPAWQKVAVVFSDSHVPGEGEHKIMQFIRGLRSQPGYNPQTSHVIYGMDADLICLGLSTHEENVTILRNQLSETFQGTPNTFCYFSLFKYRQFLKRDFKNIANMDFERVIDDFVFLCFFVGNDFLPHVPLLSIKTKGIESLLDHYVRDFQNHSYLTEKGEVKFGVLSSFLRNFVVDYLCALRQEYLELRNVTKRARANVEQRLGKGENELKEVLDSLKEDGSNAAEVSEAAHGIKLSLAKERARFVADRESMGFSYTDPDYRDAYYEKKFGWSASNRTRFEKQIKRLCGEYLRGTQWVMRYYTSGCPAWEWYYPYHYAPLLEDLAAFNGNVNVKMELGAPRHPIVQLLAVQPRLSLHALPVELHSAVMDPHSVLGKFYPDSVEVDYSEANFSYQGIMRLPFIDCQELLRACETLVELEPDRGSTLLFCHMSSRIGKLLRALLGNGDANSTMQSITPNVASKFPISGFIGPSEEGWPLHAKLKCPDAGVARNTSYGRSIRNNCMCCFAYELNTLVVYDPKLLRSTVTLPPTPPGTTRKATKMTSTAKSEKRLDQKPFSPVPQSRKRKRTDVEDTEAAKPLTVAVKESVPETSHSSGKCKKRKAI
ncbi:putative exoribonuclease 2 [Trypanosoma vivax]|nr:putative exoribonuclease 2 [Trypanosoma vivax]